MPLQLIAGSGTTRAARAVMDELRNQYPQAAYAEIDGAGHMTPVTRKRTAWLASALLQVHQSNDDVMTAAITQPVQNAATKAARKIMRSSPRRRRR